MNVAGRPLSVSERADALEQEQMEALERTALPSRSVLYGSGDRDPRMPPELSFQDPIFAGKTFLMGHDVRLARMPAQPTLLDFFKYRMAPPMHLLQSARHAMQNGASEKTILACLLHDISVLAFIRSDHGFWGAQLIEPYVDEEVSWAIRAHQVLRFYPDLDAGYEYPELYVKFFGDAYKPEPYIQALYPGYRNHKWYMTARMITVSDIYSFDPTINVDIADFSDIIARHFRQPEEGLGFDNSPSAHLWRTMNMPTRFL
jgi:hypothetical protein